ncbi:ATP-grasp domain-containing protein [Sorangium sp. So ce1078]|uniref:ATP-grasp domain-containing protein n=1 Tax=Sorangium sp. So ce1078 TaxID=3133329 RepID=UPI003F5F1BAC
MSTTCAASASISSRSRPGAVPRDQAGALSAAILAASAAEGRIHWPSARYRENPLAFFREVLGIMPWSQQTAVIEAVRDRGAGGSMATNRTSDRNVGDPCATSGHVPTLVLSQRYTPDSNALFAAALAAGWDIERLHSFRCPEGLAARAPVFYGETILADAIMDDLEIALLEPTADWLPRLPQRHRLRDVRLTTLGDALALREPAFIKPTDEKVFPARVYVDGAAMNPDPHLPLDLPVLVSEPVVFEVEFRFFVLEREVAALSPYIRGGEIARTAAGEWEADSAEVQSASASIRAVLADADVELPPAVVVDVGRMAERGWGVVEANPAWASGLCGCDPARVLPVLQRAAVPRGMVPDADQRWVRRVG